MNQEATLAVTTESTAKQTAVRVFGALCLAHLVVDGLATLLPASLGLIEIRSQLTPEQAAWLLGLGSLTSGLAQPLCALFSDRLRTRSLTVVGILLGGIGFGLLGFARNQISLSLIYILGMVGAGMFHPIAATTVAQLHANLRNLAAGGFFVAGMIGGVGGALLWPRWLAGESGFDRLPLIVLPCVLIALFVRSSHERLPSLKHQAPKPMDASSLGKNWGAVCILYGSSILRHSVNTSLVYLFVRWTQQVVASEHSHWSPAEIARAAAPTVGNLNAMMILGMAVGGMLAGSLISPGREKLPMIIVPLVFAPSVVLFPYLGIGWSYLLAVLAGAGFSAMIPVSIALAQHLLPHRANLAASLMMGGAGMVASVGPRCAEYGVTHFGFHATFLLVAIVLACSGLVCIALCGTKITCNQDA